MGGGSFSVERSMTNSVANDYANRSPRDIFRKRSIDNAMNPKGITIREARDSDEHPKSVPIIIGLDVTGSMGHIPKQLITDGLTKLMGTIIQLGVEDPQILFIAIGDHECDRAPLQVAQFESSDELLDKWLKDVYLESGGGGNAGESYPLAWYFAGNHTAIDSFEKRNKKGFLITIGDEPFLPDFPKKDLDNIMGETCAAQENKTHGQLLEEAQELYHVYHINLRETRSGGRPETYGSWSQILGDHAKNIAEHENIPQVIADIILDHEGDKDVEASDGLLIEEEKNTSSKNTELL